MSRSQGGYGCSSRAGGCGIAPQTLCWQAAARDAAVQTHYQGGSTLLVCRKGAGRRPLAPTPPGQPPLTRRRGSGRCIPGRPAGWPPQPRCSTTAACQTSAWAPLRCAALSSRARLTRRQRRRAAAPGQPLRRLPPPQPPLRKGGALQVQGSWLRAAWRPESPLRRCSSCKQRGCSRCLSPCCCAALPRDLQQTLQVCGCRHACRQLTTCE